MAEITVKTNNLNFTIQIPYKNFDELNLTIGKKIYIGFSKSDIIEVEEKESHA